ncbi:MAG: TonB-dependent receptor plug domain-containing protein, partial [Caulobacteraceae bacterium]|nr:TonB-dependent receptor plug domain-containing protein [Caulobacteraceae bacterium]
MNRSVKTIAACSVSIIALTSATFAQAQTAPAGAIDEIVVTARQRSENLKDVPAAVAALTAGTLKAAGVQRAGDFVAMVPGVSLVQAAEQGDAQVNIRGVNSARDAQSSFAFVVDGVQMANPASFNREFTDLRQIEIVKGPQGAVYGRNAAAGAIIVTTDKPNQTFQGSAALAVGNNNTITSKGRIAGPLGEKAAGSLSFDTRKT